MMIFEITIIHTPSTPYKHASILLARIPLLTFLTFSVKQVNKRI